MGGELRKPVCGKKRVASVVITPRLPPVSVEDLGQMLEIDLGFGLRADFMRRLQNALDAVANGRFSE